MTITREADYAIRIMCELARENTLVNAANLCMKSDVSLRFTLKILRKLLKAGLVKAKTGVGGGYFIISDFNKITLKDIITVIDGEIAINKCLCKDYICENQTKGKCMVSEAFRKANAVLENELEKITLASII